MTSLSEICSARLVADGVLTTFNASFLCRSATDLKVLLEDPAGNIAAAAGYSVAFIPGGGGTVRVTFAFAPAAGFVLLYRVTPSLQQTSLSDLSNFPAKFTEGALDLVTYLVQELKERAARTVHAPVGETMPAIPRWSLRLGKLLGFDLVDGHPVMVDPASLPGTGGPGPGPGPGDLTAYTIATLPVPPAYGFAVCTDLGGGLGIVESNGSAWCRLRPGQESTVLADANGSLTTLTHAQEQRDLTSLTAPRNTTLSAVRAYRGARFRITRAAAGGANRNVLNASGALLKAMNPNSWAEFIRDGADWFVAAAS